MSQTAWKRQNWEINGFEIDKNKEMLNLMTVIQQSNFIPFIKEKGIFQAT